jgi:hypothetical protein
MQDLDREHVVRIGRLDPERQRRPWAECMDAGGAGVMAEAGDGKRVVGNVARTRVWPLNWCQHFVRSRLNRTRFAATVTTQVAPGRKWKASLVGAMVNGRWKWWAAGGWKIDTSPYPSPRSKRRGNGWRATGFNKYFVFHAGIVAQGVGHLQGDPLKKG